MACGKHQYCFEEHHKQASVRGTLLGEGPVHIPACTYVVPHQLDFRARRAVEVPLDLALLRASALRGEGLALLPKQAVGADLEAGRLRWILQGQVGTRFPVCLVYADRDYIAPKVRAFVDHAAQRLPRWFERIKQIES